MSANPRAVQIHAPDGVVLALDAWGDPQRPPVVFAHGGGQTRGAWGAAAQAVAEAGWYTLSLDLRGHGESGWDPDGDYAPRHVMTDVRAVATHLGRPPVWVGASFGGLLGMLAEGEASAPLLAGLVLVDIAPRMEIAGVRRIFDFMRARPEGYESVEAVAEAIASYLPHRKAPSDLSGLTRNLRQREDGRWAWHWDPRFLERTVEDFKQDVRDYYTAAKRLRLPTMIVRGRMSDVLSEEGVQEFLTLAPHARYTDVSGAGHMVAGDRNDAFTEAVVSFLATVEEGPLDQAERV